MPEQNETIVVDDVAAVAGAGVLPAGPDEVGDEPFRLIVDETPPAPAVDAEKEALKARLAAAEADAVAARGAPVEAIARGLEALTSRVTPPSPSVQQPTEDFAEVKKRLNEKYYEDPVAAQLELLERYKNHEDAGTVKRNLAVSYELAAKSADDAAFLAKYKKEIDEEVARLPVDVRQNDPGAVRKAMRVVRADHLDELVADAVAKVTPGAPVAPVQGRAAPAQYAEVPGARAVSQAREVRVTSQQKAMIDAFVAVNPVTESVAYSVLARRGWRW